MEISKFDGDHMADQLMDPTMRKLFMFLPTTKDVWEAVRETYSDLENHS